MRLAGNGAELWSGHELITVSEPHGPRPTERFAAATVVSPDCSAVLVLGGVQGHIIGGVFLNDVWHFDVEQRTWEQLSDELDWEARHSAFALAVPCATMSGPARLILLGGVGHRGNYCQDVWTADIADGWKPCAWQNVCKEAPWREIQFAMWVPHLRSSTNTVDESACGWLYVFEAAGAVYRSADLGETWLQVTAKPPFGDSSDPIAFVLAPAPGLGAADLVAVTHTSNVFSSPDGGRTWVPQTFGPPGPGSRSQVTGVAGDGNLLVASRSRDTSQLSLWSLVPVPPASGKAEGTHWMWPLAWVQLVPKVGLNPAFSQFNQLATAGRRSRTCNDDSMEPGVIFVEFNAIDEFTIWRASPVAVLKHRRMLERMGTRQLKIDRDIWCHVIDCLLPTMDSKWVPEVLAASRTRPSTLADEEEEEDSTWDYWR